MLQIILNLILFTALVIPLGSYLYKVAECEKTKLDVLFNPIDNFICRICFIDRNNMGWKKYAMSLLLTNAMLTVLGYFVLRFQNVLFFNPNMIGAMEESLSFNTIISFITNTNLQHYSGESGLSYLSQMLVITMMMFTSAATGYSACMAMARGLCGKNMGNYFIDMVRVTTRVLIPLAVIVGLFLVSQGVPQTISENATVSTIEGKMQDIPLGPIASLVSIKHLGTNGGGFLGANSSTPFENPNVITNIVEMLSMMIIPGACVIVFGLMFHNTKKDGLRKRNAVRKKPVLGDMVFFGKEGRTIFIAMSIIFLIGLGVCYWAETTGNPALAKVGLNQNMGSMEGKESRFGIAQSAMFSTVTTAFTTGTVNNMHDTLTPLGGMITLLNMMLNVVFGGVGVGFMNMVLYAILAVFICGLMIGRTPEYLGKKIDSKEMKLAVLCIIIHPLLILGFSALAVSVKPGLDGITNEGFHGLSQILYEYSSAAANNGSGFEGLADNSYFWNMTTGLTMFIGRYASIVIQLAIAGSLMQKHLVSESVGTLKTGTVSFAVVLSAVVLIFAALTFFPVVALGPIAEYLVMGVTL